MLSSGQELSTSAPAAMMRGQADCCALSADCPAAPLLQDVLRLLLPAPFPIFELFLLLIAGQLVPCAPPALHPPALAAEHLHQNTALRTSIMADTAMIACSQAT